MSTTIITEHLDLTEGTLDAEARTVRQRIIQAGWSRNGRHYSTDVLSASAGLFENVKVFANHPSKTESKERPGRSIAEIAGWLSDVRYENGALVGTRHFTDNQAGRDSFALVKQIVEGKAPPTLMGASINAVGKAVQGERDGREGLIVEAITAAQSVDDVTFPAAGGGFDKLMMGGDDLLAAVLEAMDEDEWRAARPEFVDRLKREWQVVRQTEAVSTAHAERDEAQRALVEADKQMDTLKEELAQRETELVSLRAQVARKAAEVELEKALREAKLPSTWEDELRQQLERAETDQWAAIVEAEKRKAAGATEAKRVSVQGAPQRVAAPMMATTVQPVNGGIYLGEDDTPETLEAKLTRRG